MAGLATDSAGNLYGTTNTGGNFNLGSVFKLTLGKNNTWTQKVIYSFKGYANKDGAYPYYAGVTVDAAGDVYGTTYQGGSSAANNLNYGTVYKLTAGTYKESVLWSFGTSWRRLLSLPRTRFSSMESSMVRPQAAEPMEGASYMRLHRSQGLQDSALVRLYFLAAGPYGSAAIFLLRRMSALVGGVGLCAKNRACGRRFGCVGSVRARFGSAGTRLRLATPAVRVRWVRLARAAIWKRRPECFVLRGVNCFL